MKLKLTLALTLTLAIAISAHAAEKPRAIWIMRWSSDSPEAVSRMVEKVKANGFTDIVFQIRGDGLVLYKSKLEGRSDVLANAPADFDPLAQVIPLAHAAGIKVHVWINSCSVWTQRTPPKDPNHLTLKHPDWLMVSTSSRGRGRGQSFADPGNADYRKYFADLCEEVVKNYDVDGVHFDYIRYPGHEVCYCDKCLAGFKKRMDAQIKPEETVVLDANPDRLKYQKLYPAKWDQYRRDQVTTMVREVRDRVKAIKPKVQISASTIVWGGFAPFQETDAYREVFQDWHAWMRDGLVDFVCPMIYTTNIKTLTEHVADAVRDGGKCPVWAGLGCYISTPTQSVAEVEAAYQAGAQGVCLFAYDSMQKGDLNQDEVFKLLREGPFAKP